MDNKGITGSFNVNSFNKIVHTTITDDKNQILQWLSPLEPQRRHQHLRESRLEGVGEWIFQTSEFRRWNTREDGSSGSMLFCHGDPGVGKTHLSSVVIDHFYGRRQDITVTGLYCDYLDRKEQTTSNMLGAILKQLVGGTIPEETRKAFEDAKEHFGGVGPRVPELVQMLKTTIAQRQRVVICIDGLDESFAVHRTGLFRALQAIVRELPNVRLFLTGRPFIRGEVESYFPGVDAILVSPSREDTEALLRLRLDEDTEPDAMDASLRADIMEIIPSKISEIFLLVSLSIETILEETTIHRRREKLKQMSSGRDSGDVYTATLERIGAQKGDRARLGMDAIMWIAYSERPLQPEELCQALGVEIGSTDMNSDNAPSIRTILNCGLGLVTVDSSSSKVRLVHFTLQEYILANPTLFDRPHSMMTEVCLTYLNFGCIRSLSLLLSSPPLTTPFLEYASYYWGTHARREPSAKVIPLALELLDRFNAHISCKLLLLRESGFEGFFGSESRPWGAESILFNSTGYGISFSALHCGAWLDVPEIMVSLLETRKYDLNATDWCGHTALLLATRKGHDRIVKLLLEQEGVNPNLPDGRGRRPLISAVSELHEEIARMLSKRNDANPNTRDESDRLQLSWAAGERYERIVEMLLLRSDVNPNMADRNGRTPLSWGAGEGHERNVKMLLQRSDVDCNAVDQDDRTPFLWAIKNQREGVVKLLLERSDVDHNRGDKSGRTPLSWAVWNEDEGIVTIVAMLLGRNDINPNLRDKSGRTPLSWAAGEGYERGVKMLLQRSDVDLDAADEDDRTPFLWAVKNQHEGVVRLLLERNDVSHNSRDKSGRTPFSWAAENGSPRIATMLLERNHVKLDGPDKGGRTPLSWAAEKECTLIVRMLLERDDVDPNSCDRSGRTPISWAAGAWSARSVTIILERNHVNPSTADKSGRTPLSWAAQTGCERIVERLLERNDVNPDGADKSGRTPLSWAAMFGREKIVRMLLERNCACPDTAYENGRALFSWAAKSGYKGIVGILLDKNDLNHGTAEGIGQRPFALANILGHEEIVETFPQQNNVDPNTADKSSRTQFSWTAKNGSAKDSPGQEELHDTNSLASHWEEPSEPSTTEPPQILEPPLKRVRRF